MMETQNKTTETVESRPAEYQRPELRRWGSLRELTAGGGGLKNEPVTKNPTRF